MAELNWSVEFYSDPHGSPVVEEWLDSLPLGEQVRIGKKVALLEQYGVERQAANAKHIEGRIWELRVGSVRLLYFAHTGRRFVILHAFRKKSQKIPERELATARRRLDDQVERDTDSRG